MSKLILFRVNYLEAVIELQFKITVDNRIILIVVIILFHILIEMFVYKSLDKLNL